MKRLLTVKADFDPNMSEQDIEDYTGDLEAQAEELMAWVSDQDCFDNKSINADWIIRYNPDCVFSGTLYRTLELDTYRFTDQLKEAKYPLTSKKILAMAKKHISNKSKYSSFTKNLQSAYNFNSNVAGAKAIIATEKSGLDVNAWADKWNQFYQTFEDGEWASIYSHLDKFRNEEEVIALHDKNYTVFCVGDVEDNGTKYATLEEAAAACWVSDYI